MKQIVVRDSYKTPSGICILPVFITLAFCTLTFSTSAQSAGKPSTGWQQAGWGGGGYYWAAVYHPKQDGVIYLAGDSCGVYKTEDHGRHWRIINQGLSSYGTYSLAVSRSEPQTVYAATEAGLCKSTDGGEHWQPLPHTGPKELRLTGERNRSIRSIAVDPSNGSIVYAASPAGKVYKSADGGQTWAVSYEKKASEEEGGALRVQFGKINGAYYGDFAMPVAFPSAVKASDCTGIGFSVRGDGSMPKDCFLILKTKSGVAYRSKNLNAIYKETEWREIVLKADDFALDPDYVKAHPAAAATPSALDWSAVDRLDLACSGALPMEATVGKFGKFFFAVAASSNQPRLVTFRDFAQDKALQTFGNIHLGPPSSGTIYSVVVSMAKPAWVVAATHEAGLVLSRDAGRTWHALGTPAKAACAAFDPTDPNVIYGAFFQNGIMKSSDGGKTWDKLSKSLSSKSEIIDVAVSPANPLDLYAIGSVDWNGAFYLSKDGGATWKTVSIVSVDAESNPTLDNVFSGTANLSAPRMIALSPTNPMELFISANWRSCLSTDGGLTWTERDRGADISCVTDIRFHKGRTYVTAMDEGTFVSENNGQSWRQLWPLRHTPGLSGHNWRVAVNEVAGQERILSTVTPWYKTPTCLVRSDDGGKSFNVVTNGLPDYTIRPNTMWGQGHPRALAVDPNNPQLVYLGIDGDPADGKRGGGIFKSGDGGSTWAQLPSQPASRRMFYGLAVDPTDSKRLFWGACGSSGGVHRSEDGGLTWKLVFRNEIFIWNVLVTAEGIIYCSGQQLWRSTDHGDTWKQVTHFVEKQSLVALEVHPRDPKTLWVAATTWDSLSTGGVFKTTDGGATWMNITGNLPCVKPQLLRFNPETSELWAGHVGLYKCKQ
jgi:photosystem II stability/assembly factor-like uncharacterized protein